MAEPEDRAEENSHGRRPVRGAPARREDREEEHAKSEDPGEDGADRDVICSCPVAELAHPDPGDDRGSEEPDPNVDPERGRRERACEGNVAECVAREDLRTEHEEVADEPAGGADERAGEERVAHELLGEHVSGPSARALRAR